MSHGICHLSTIAVRETPNLFSPMQSQLLYGDVFKFKEQRKFWSRVETLFDSFEGWVANNQVALLTDAQIDQIINNKEHRFNIDLVSFITDSQKHLIAIPIGSEVANCELFQHKFEGNLQKNPSKDKVKIIETALLYLNSPYLEGGKSPFGVDNSGFTQMVYKINGHQLFRTVHEQSNQGEVLSFIEECEPGDLAFFDNNEGVIDHVGIVLKNNYIIHAHGKVRVDRIDHTGIFNAEQKQYSHKLRVLKKVL